MARFLLGGARLARAKAAGSAQSRGEEMTRPIRIGERNASRGHSIRKAGNLWITSWIQTCLNAADGRLIPYRRTSVVNRVKAERFCRLHGLELPESPDHGSIC